MSRGSGAGRRNLNRSWRARLASRHVGGAASGISPACWAARTGNEPRGAKLLDAASPRARRRCQFPGGIFPLGRSAGASRRASGATSLFQQSRLSVRSAALDRPIMVGHWGRASRRRRRLGFFCGALGRVRGEQPDERDTPGCSAVSGAPPRSFARWYLPGRTGRRSIAASRRSDVAVSAESAVAPIRRARLSGRTHHRSWWATGAARHVGSVTAANPPAEFDCAKSGKSTGRGVSERSAALGESAPTVTRRHSPLRLNGDLGRRTRWATWLPSQARH